MMMVLDGVADVYINSTGTGQHFTINILQCCGSGSSFTRSRSVDSVFKNRIWNLLRYAFLIMSNKFVCYFLDLNIYRVDQKSWRVRKNFTVASKIDF